MFSAFFLFQKLKLLQCMTDNWIMKMMYWKKPQTLLQSNSIWEVWKIRGAVMQHSDKVLPSALQSDKIPTCFNRSLKENKVLWYWKLLLMKSMDMRMEATYLIRKAPHKENPNGRDKIKGQVDLLWAVMPQVWKMSWDHNLPRLH